MFGNDAPIWRFIAGSRAQEDPIASRKAAGGSFLMEVYPALALPSFNPAFSGRDKIPRYNPANRKKFRHEDWVAVVDTVRAQAKTIECEALVMWCDKLLNVDAPKKCNQDMLDAAICLLVAIQ